MDTYTLSHEDLDKLLCEQLTFLRASCSAFDNGAESEAKRMALAVRILFHDTKSMVSLLKQMGKKSSVVLLSTATPYNRRSLMPYTGLVVMKLEAPPDSPASITYNIAGSQRPYSDSPTDKPKARMTYVPLSLAQGQANTREMRFPEWWDEIVIRDGNAQIFRRGTLILAVADKDGGAHVDRRLEAAYARLSRFNGVDWRVTTNNSVRAPDNSVVAASIRQVAQEVIESLERTFPEVCVQYGM